MEMIHTHTYRVFLRHSEVVCFSFSERCFKAVEREYEKLFRLGIYFSL